MHFQPLFNLYYAYFMYLNSKSALRGLSACLFLLDLSKGNVLFVEAFELTKFLVNVHILFVL